MEWTTNAVGRRIPVEIEGRRLRPFAGAHADSLAGAPARRTAGGPSRTPPGRGAPDKRVAGWDDLLDRMDVRSGQTISFHHHLRDGDAVVNEVVARLAARGVRDLTIAATLFSVHERLIPYIESGAIAKIEGSMYGPVGAACTRGAMKGLCVLRSHGGRQRAIQDGELHIDATFIAAPCADPFGNANGAFGKSACGPLTYSVPGSLPSAWRWSPTGSCRFRAHGVPSRAATWTGCLKSIRSETARGSSRGRPSCRRARRSS
jgi:citrate lyase subunit alpha / citrate CoA-transferase